MLTRLFTAAVLLVGAAALEASAQSRGEIWYGVTCKDGSAGPPCPEDMTPEQRKALEERRAREAAERAAREAERRRKVDAVMKEIKLPPHRRAEAERLLAMREAAESSRPKPQAVRQCSSPAHPMVEKYHGETVALATSQISVPRSCEGGSIVAQSCSPPNWAWPTATCTVRYSCPARSFPCPSNQQ